MPFRFSTTPPRMFRRPAGFRNTSSRVSTWWLSPAAKALRGPQASGLLLGRADLIAAGRHAISPQMGIGRGMKVGKEEIMGLLAAVERFLTIDHDAEWRLWETRVAEMIEMLAGIPGVNLRRDVPEIANHSPHLLIEWSRWHVALSAADVVRQLREGDPPIAALAEAEYGLRIAVWTLRDDEHRIVAKRIRDISRVRNEIRESAPLGTQVSGRSVRCRGGTGALLDGLSASARFCLSSAIRFVSSSFLRSSSASSFSSSAMRLGPCRCEVVALWFLPRFLQLLDRGLQQVTRNAREAEVVAAEASLEHRQGLLQFELANRHPGPQPHRAIRIVAAIDERFLERRVILGQPAERTDGCGPNDRG